MSNKLLSTRHSVLLSSAVKPPFGKELLMQDEVVRGTARLEKCREEFPRVCCGENANPAGAAVVLLLYRLVHSCFVLAESLEVDVVWIGPVCG